MSAITYKIAAKTDVGLVRTNNEDNLCVISNLDLENSTWVNNDICQLGRKGALLVVADGMGGMNAGEVASEIAVTVVKERFTHEVTDDVLESDESIVKFMNETIVCADKTIKSEGKHRPEAKGMGTTIVIAWLYNGKLFVSWCGDSRAYIFNRNNRLFQISKDHSYVQELVDKGIVKPEDAFDFPESNVITRCLSHSSLKAEPSNLAEPYTMDEGDIVMLCTDGLSGMIRDEEIARVMAAHTDNMAECVDALIEAAKVAAGADNVTVCLCQMLPSKKPIGRTDTKEIDLASTTVNEKTEEKVQKVVQKAETPAKEGKKKGKRTKLMALLLTVLVILLAVGAMWYFGAFGGNGDSKADDNQMVTDSVVDSSAADTAGASSDVEGNAVVSPNAEMIETAQTGAPAVSK